MPTAAVILAAGRGTRMRSDLPKVLHSLAGLPMVDHAVAAALEAGAAPVVVVVGYRAALVRAAVRARFPKKPVAFALQREQRGTGHAVRCALGALRGFRGEVLILYGDLPLVRGQTLRALARARRRKPLALASARLEDAGAYGRLVRSSRGRVLRVVEAKDASPTELSLREINSGLYAADAAFLRRAVPRLRPDNRQREYYLTDLVAIAAAEGGASVLELTDAREVLGVNTVEELAAAEAQWMARRALSLEAEGVDFEDPTSVRIEADVRVDAGARIGRGVRLLGATHIGAGALVEAGAVLQNCEVAAGVRIGADAVLEGVTAA